MIQIPNSTPTESAIKLDTPILGSSSSLEAITLIKHASSHITGGTDVIDDFTSTKSGLAPASGGGTSKFLRADASWATIYSSYNSKIIESSLYTEKFPLTRLFYRNKYGNTNSPTSVIPSITITSVDTTNSKIVVSDLPNGVDLINTTSGYPWFINVIDNTLTDDPASTDPYTITLRVDAVDVTTKTITYTSGRGTPVVGYYCVFYNPLEDGFTRDAANPIMQVSDFSWTAASYLNLNGYMWKQDGSLRIFAHTTGAAIYYVVYAETSDFINWTYSTSNVFDTGLPSWAPDLFFIHGEATYLSDEGVYFAYGSGYDKTNVTYSIGWCKFAEDFSSYEYSTDPIITTTDADLFFSKSPINEQLRIVGESNNGLGNPTVVERNGEYIMLGRVYTKYTGTHTGTTGAAILTDANAIFEPSTLGTTNNVGLYNVTDGSSAAITTNTQTTVTGTLSGGINNSWTNGDSYKIYDVTTRKLFIATSNNRLGPFTMKGIIPMGSYVNDSMAGSYWLSHNCIFWYKGNLYLSAGASSKYSTSGSRGNFLMDLYTIDLDNCDLVRLEEDPAFMNALWMDLFGYTTLQWEADHLGNFYYIVDNTNSKLRCVYSATYGSNNYKIGIASKDLSTIE